MFKKILLIVSLVSTCFTLEYPLSSWGQIRYSNGDLYKGIESSYFFEQGINWKTFNIFTFNTFIGIKPSICDNEEYYWKNKINPSIGFKIRQKLDFYEEFWSNLEYGIKYEYNNYFFEKQKIIDGTNSFINFGLGGDLDKKNRKFFKSFPLSSWMSLNFIRGNIKESDCILSGNIQQGINIFSIKNYNLKYFISYSFVHSNDNISWNNQIGIITGLEINTPFLFKKQKEIYGNLTLNIRYEKYKYTKTNENDETQIITAFSWYFGGNLDKKLNKGQN